MVSEAPDRLEQHRVFVDAAVDAGVRHLVYISFYGAIPDATFTLVRDHLANEEHIRAGGLTFTFLREDGVTRGPAGDGRWRTAHGNAHVLIVATAVQRQDVHHPP